MSINDIPRDAVLRMRVDTVSWTPTHNGEVILLDHLNAAYLTGNATAAMLWKLLANGTTPRELEMALIDAFGIDPAVARGDVARFVGAALSRGLLESLD